MALAALGKREGCFKKRLASLPVFTLAFLFFSFLLLPFSPLAWFYPAIQDAME